VTPKQLFQSGKLNEAIVALGAELRDNPTDVQRRTFLFELLCFAGEYDRAEKHLNLLADQGPQAQLGAVLYFSSLHAERLRQDMFRKNDFPISRTPVPAENIQGSLNGQEFGSFEDADPRIGTRIEVFAAGAYLWIPVEHIVSIEMEAPKRLRDLMWIPALVRTGPAFKEKELGEVLLPTISPLSYVEEDPNIKLGRVSEWRETEEGPRPVGQKQFLVDGDEFPILEVRKLEFHVAAEAKTAVGSE
jgi:type VI secretion system protein ImpE